MTSQMYAMQAPAVAAASAYQPPKTNSSPDHPPVHTVDLKAACAAKKKIVESLPTECGHCGTPFNASNCIVELAKTGDVMAYCRGQGGCGRSQVLFVGVKTSIPRYRKVCVFKTSEQSGRPKELPHQPLDMYALHGITRPETICDTCGQRYDSHPAGYDHVFKGSAQCDEPKELLHQPLDIYALHGIMRPETICDTCGQRYDSHPTGYDHNGWLEDGTDQLELPADWPTFRDGKFVSYGKH